MNYLSQGFAVFVMLAILSILIIVHECGHFLVARFFGFQTPVFGFGLPFGPSWTIGKRWNTEFKVHACLLGGYVAIPELGDETELTNEGLGLDLLPFRKFPIWQRVLVAFAGVGFNMIFAYLVMVVMLLSLGDPMQTTKVYDLVAQNPIATKAGVLKDDILLSVNGKSVTSPTEAVGILTKFKKQVVTLELKRKGKPIELKMETNENGKVGIVLITEGEVHYKRVQGTIPQIFWLGLKKTGKLCYYMVDAIRSMVSGLFSSSNEGGGVRPKGSWQDIHGILAVVKIGADIAQKDWTQLFLFTILISLDLAIFNLVPWPALDGGHIAFMVIEAVRGKPVGPEVQGQVMKWGFVSLFALVCLVMVNDVTALMTGKLDMKHSSPGKLKKMDEKDIAPVEIPSK